MRLILIVMALLPALLVSGCAGDANGAGRPTSTEPGIIIIRNRTPSSIREVTLSQAGGSRSEAFARISPVPARSDQVFYRATRRIPLPRSVTITWIDAGRETHVKDVELGNLLRETSGLPGEALVFTIVPQRVEASVEVTAER